jgi:hypothetical protein
MHDQMENTRSDGKESVGKLDSINNAQRRSSVNTKQNKGTENKI